MTASSLGLEDIVAAESAITWIDGNAGELRYRGYDIGELAQTQRFEDVAYLLWHGELPDRQASEDLRAQLRAERERPDLLRLLDDVPRSAHPLDLLRYVVSWDALSNPLTADNGEAANFAKAIQFTAWFPTVVAAFARLRRGERPVGAPRDLDTAAAFLFMLNGRAPDSIAARTLNTSLVLHADHELNASTFAARVTIATQSNLHAAIASALGTLVGPRHGGASDRVIAMLEDIGTADRVESYVQRELAAHRRIMGYGHRVYKTVDPRSRHLREMAEAMLQAGPHAEWAAILARLSDVMQREKNRYPNVDLYAAIVNHELGIDPSCYTAIFSVSRIVGWTAHAMEQLGGRMIRPVAHYTGSPRRRLEAVAAV